MSRSTRRRAAATSRGGRPARGTSSSRPTARDERPGRVAGGPAGRSGTGLLVGLAGGGLLVGLLAGAGLAGALAGDGGAAAAPSPAASAAPGGEQDAAARLQARAAELREQSAARDDEAFTVLVDDVQQVAAEVAPVVQAAAAHAEPGAPAPSPDEAAQWSAAVEAASAGLTDSGSAGTDVNLARTAVEASLHQLGTATDALVQAAALAAAGEDPAGPLRTGVGTLQAAVLTWSVGATQIDAVSVERDRGHLHVYLPGVTGSGALTADEAEEGEPAHAPGGEGAHEHADAGGQAHDDHAETSS